MPIEIEQNTRRGPVRRVHARVNRPRGLAGGWTSTMPSGTRNSPFAGLGAVIAPAQPNEAVGMQLSFRGTATSKAPTEAELGSLIKPFLKSYQYTILDAKYVADNNPIWTWAWDAQNKVWVSTVAAGPFAGTEGDIISQETSSPAPTYQKTLELPRGLYSYVVTIRPTNLEMTDDKAGLLRSELRAKLFPTFKSAGINISLPSAKVLAVAAPPNPEKKAATGTAAIIGVALSMLTWWASKSA